MINVGGVALNGPEDMYVGKNESAADRTSAIASGAIPILIQPKITKPKAIHASSSDILYPLE